MGKLVDGTDMHSFWLLCSEANALYVLSNTCSNCGDATFFYSTDKGYCQVGNSEDFVDVSLNANVLRQGYGMTWTIELDLSYSVTVSIGKPINQTVIVPLGYTAERAGALMGADINDYVLKKQRNK